MKKLAAAVAAAALMAIGAVGSAGATALLDEQTPQWGCPGYGAWAAAGAAYNPTSNPTFKKLADKLGMSTDDLAAQIKANKSVAEIAKAKGVNLDDLVDIIDAPMDEMMQVMVKNGFMTKDQADAVDKWRESREKAGLEQQGYAGGMMGPGMMNGYGMGGMMGPRFAPGAGNQPQGYGPGARGQGGMMRGWQNRTN